jgi:hypothetical protein
MPDPIQFPLHRTLLIGVCSLVLTACELINPDEQIPSFLRIEEYSLVTSASQGIAVHKLTDAWVFVDEELVGVYELPASIPVLSAGPTKVRIEAGSRVSGLVGQRASNPFMNHFNGTIELFADSHLVFNPVMTYTGNTVFKWMEEFSDPGVSLVATSLNDGDLVRVSGSEAYAGQSFKMSLTESQLLVECATALAYPLPGLGAPVYLEFSYRNNNSLYVGLISGTPGGVTQTSVLVLNPSADWNHVYVNLTSVLSSGTLAGAIGHQVFFGFLRDQGVTGEAYAVLDNIKLMH